MIPLVKPYLPPKEHLLPALEGVLYSGYIAEGEKVKEFEQKFGEFINNPFSISVNSGSSALHLALLLAGVSPGDEVISTALTAEPTNTVIRQTGAKLVWADIDPRTGMIDAKDAAAQITDRTKAIVVVHYAGIPVDLSAFAEISSKFGIAIIEDAAHALGAKYQGKMIGSISPSTIFSFQAIKHLTTVDGGMVTFNNRHASEKCRIIRWFGLDKTKTRFDNDISVQGYKYHMNNVNATVGIVQMDFIGNVIQQYISNGKYFDRALLGIPGIDLISYYQGSEPSYWLYTMLVDNRADFIRKLAEHQIMASELHKRNDEHSFFSSSRRELPNLDQFYSRLVHIPTGWWVDVETRERIAHVIKSGW